MKLSPFFLSLAAAGILAAQPAPAPKMHHRSADQMVQQMNTKMSLNLTADQQNQAKAVFQQARQDSKALAPKLKEERQAINSAIKADNEQQIDSILQENAQINTQARAIHAKAMAKFYKILTPDQQSKFEHNRMNRVNRPTM